MTIGVIFEMWLRNARRQEKRFRLQTIRTEKVTFHIQRSGGFETDRNASCGGAWTKRWFAAGSGG